MLIITRESWETCIFMAGSDPGEGSKEGYPTDP